MSQLTPTPDSSILTKPRNSERMVFLSLLKPLADLCKPPLTKAQADTYFGLLSDLPFKAIQAAAAEIAASREYPTWPMPGEIRKVVVAMMGPPRIEHGQAWRLALIASRKMIDAKRDDYRIFRNGRCYTETEWNQHVLDGLPAPIAEALRQFGWKRMTEDAATYAQFRDVYNILANRERVEVAQLPTVKQIIQASKQIGVDR